MRVAFSIATVTAAQAAVLLCLSFGYALAQPTVSLIGNSEKICQLTGEVDWETGAPTAARTLSNFGLDAVDLGYPVENRGKLILLFGDTWPSKPGGPGGEIGPNDAVGVTVRTAPPTKDQCLGLTINHTTRPKLAFLPPTIVRPPQIAQGWFNVPSGGVSVDGALNAFFWTDHCASPQHLLPSPHDPLARPAGNVKCPETDRRNSVGAGVFARSVDEGRSFTNVAAMPIGFVYSLGINTQKFVGLPDGQRLGVYVLGVTRFRASIPYLAYAPPGVFDDPKAWRYFVGLRPGGAPNWVAYEAWQRGRPRPAPPEAPGWSPPGDAEIIGPASDADRTIGEFSVTWHPALRSWLMLYSAGSAIEARVAPAVWGPWSAPITLLSGNKTTQCRMIMVSTGCGSRRNYWPKKSDGSFVGGGFYAPFVLNRFTIARETRAGRRATIYWLVSTWNPYEVSVMRSTLELAP